jgi:hypothetical protein
MPAGNAHRILSTLYDAFTHGIGPGILNDPGDGGVIRPTLNFQICEMISVTSETRTLANPNRAGIRFILRLLTDGGDVVVTAENGLNALNETEATLADAGDFLSLVSVTKSTGVFRWEVMEGNVGTVVSSTSPSSSPSSSPSASASSSPSAT